MNVNTLELESNQKVQTYSFLFYFRALYPSFAKTFFLETMLINQLLVLAGMPRLPHARGG
jgi:hypothetical protein